MRILQIVTLVTPTGAYGGPVTVATNQARTLLQLGHEVTVLAARYVHEAKPPTHLGGAPLLTFPARRIVPRTGFAGLTAPGAISWFVKNHRSFDVVHIHVARDLVTLPLAALARILHVPFVTQTHGMIAPSGKILSKPLDVFFTKPTLKAARRVFFLTTQEERDLIQIAPRGLVPQQLRNGVPPAPATTGHHANRDSLEVLYVARFHQRKRPITFAQAAVELSKEFPTTSFTMYGPDEGEGAAVTRCLKQAQTTRVSWKGALAPDAVVSVLSRAHILAMPSVNEPFPMTVLEAMSVGTVPIVTHTCGLSKYLARIDPILVISDSARDLERALRALLRDTNRLQCLSQEVKRMAQTEFSMASVGQVLEVAYGNILEADPYVA